MDAAHKRFVFNAHPVGGQSEVAVPPCLAEGRLRSKEARRGLLRLKRGEQGASLPAAAMQFYGHDDDDIDLRWCKRCGKHTYLRKKACVNSRCVGPSVC